MSDRRLVEVSLPLQEIAAESSRERFVRRGHISTLHTWWARRPLAACRAAVFATLVDAPEDEAERKELEDLIATIVGWDHVKDGNSPKIDEAKRLILQEFDGERPKVLDPFAGGGSIPLELQRLGCEAHAVELDPVAHLIELCTLVYPQKYGQPRMIHGGEAEEGREAGLLGREHPDETAGDVPITAAGQNRLAEDVRKWGNWVLEHTRQEIGHLYEDPKVDNVVVGYLWARTLTCLNPACGAEIPLVRRWWLARRRDDRIALEPVVDRERKNVSFDIVDFDRHHGGGSDPSRGSIDRGRASCMFCGTVIPPEHIQQEAMSGRMGQRLMAVIHSSGGRNRYRPADQADELVFRQAESLLEDLDPNGDLTPDATISVGNRLAGSFAKYGISHWSDLFNSRQKAALVSLIRQVRAAYQKMLDLGEVPDYARAVTTYLGLAIDHALNYGSSLTQWQAMSERFFPALSRMTLSMVWDYAEVNLTRKDSIWDGALRRIISAIEHAAAASDRAATVHPGTATRLPYPEGYFDAVITDPPYYDAVPYKDLSDFYYVWLQKSLGSLYPDLFFSRMRPRSSEVVSSGTLTRSTVREQAPVEDHTRMLREAFRETSRVLTPDGVLVFLYFFQAFSSLELLVSALSEAGLQITMVHPFRTEKFTGSATSKRGSASHSSILVACRKQSTGTARGDYLHVRAQVRAAVRASLRDYGDQEWVAESLFLRAVRPALRIISQSQPIEKADGERVGMLELLRDVQEEVTDFIMVQEHPDDELK